MSKIIRVSDETHQLVDSMGRRGETFDDIVARVFQAYTKFQSSKANGEKL